MPRPSRPALGARYDRRRLEVVDAAAREFARSGYAETTVAQLSSAIGIAAGGIYHYFDTKQELLVAICERVMDPLLDEAEALIEQDDGDPEQQLRELVRLWVRQVVGFRDHMLVFQQQRHAIESGARWREVRTARKRFERLVGAALERVGADRRLALVALLGMVNHTAQWYRPRGPLSPDAIADGYVDVLLAPRTSASSSRSSARSA